VLPVEAQDNLADGALRATELGGQDYLRYAVGPSFADCDNLGLRKNRLRTQLSVNIVAFFSPLVCRILSAGANPQMIRIYAGRIIASVQNTRLTRWWRPEGQCP
jgi:hypothetical protein